MTAMQHFHFEDENVRIHMRDDEPWFVLIDVCRVLEIKNASDASGRLDDDEKGEVGITDPIGRDQQTTIINESGLYSLILRSRTQTAKRFKKWVTSDLLPTLRRTGIYHMKDSDPDLRAMVDGRTLGGRSRLDAKIDLEEIRTADRIYGPEAARKLWESMPWLPQVGDKAVGAMVDTAIDDPVGCFNHLMRSAVSAGRPARDLVSFAMYDSAARKGLGDYGMLIDPAGAPGYLAVANKHKFLTEVFSDTQWRDDWRFALAQLPGAKVSVITNAFGKEKSRSVLISRGEVLGLLNPLTK